MLELEVRFRGGGREGRGWAWGDGMVRLFEGLMKMRRVRNAKRWRKSMLRYI